MWTALALAVLTKGLVAIVFLFGTATVYLALTGEYRNWRQLKPLTGLLLFLAIAAPWHILAGLRNTGGMNGHGFFWFYFINEHVLRFLGQPHPRWTTTSSPAISTGASTSSGSSHGASLSRSFSSTPPDAGAATASSIPTDSTSPHPGCLAPFSSLAIASPARAEDSSSFTLACLLAWPPGVIGASAPGTRATRSRWPTSNLRPEHHPCCSPSIPSSSSSSSRSPPTRSTTPSPPTSPY